MKSNNSLLLYGNSIPSTFLVITIFLFLFSSCITQRNLEYLQNKNKNTLVYNEADIEDYKLKPNDELFIQINTPDDITTNIFSGTSSQPSFMGTIDPYGAYLLSYTIDKEGYLNLPYIDKLLVKDKTIAEVVLLLKESLTSIISYPVVSVKLVNRYVSVLGEVYQPGHYAYAQEKLTILDAVGLAGDITEFGNRKEVVISRNEDGKNIRTIVDLTQSEILASDSFYIQPNDIVYIKPLRKKFWSLREFPYETILSAITTAILLYSVL